MAGVGVEEDVMEIDEPVVETSVVAKGKNRR